MTYLVDELLQMEFDPIQLRLRLQPDERLLGEHGAGLLRHLVRPQDDSHLERRVLSTLSVGRTRTQGQRATPPKYDARYDRPRRADGNSPSDLSIPIICNHLSYLKATRHSRRRYAPTQSSSVI